MDAGFVDPVARERAATALREAETAVKGNDALQATVAAIGQTLAALQASDAQHERYCRERNDANDRDHADLWSSVNRIRDALNRIAWRIGLAVVGGQFAVIGYLIARFRLTITPKAARRMRSVGGFSRYRLTTCRVCAAENDGTMAHLLR